MSTSLRMAPKSPALWEAQGSSCGSGLERIAESRMEGLSPIAACHGPELARGAARGTAVAGVFDRTPRGVGSKTGSEDSRLLYLITTVCSIQSNTGQTAHVDSVVYALPPCAGNLTTVLGLTFGCPAEASARGGRPQGGVSALLLAAEDEGDLYAGPGGLFACCRR